MIDSSVDEEHGFARGHSSRPVRITRADGTTRDGEIQGGEMRETSWGIAVEAPVEISLNGTPWTVMLATPTDVEELAIGLALTERVLRDASAVHQVTVAEYLHEISVNLIVPEDALDRDGVRGRVMAGKTGCGLCGIDSLVALRERRGISAAGHDAVGGLALGDNPGPDAPDWPPVADAPVLRAFAELPTHQPINRQTHSVHAAAWCTPDGAIQLAREDVGRHNALDKLIGAMAQRGMLAQAGFIVMTSRCSYELVYKAILANTHLLATISAPTTMALEWADALGLPLASYLRDGNAARVVRFPTDANHGEAQRAS